MEDALALLQTSELDFQDFQYYDEREEQFNPRLWSQLPEQVLERILAFLPLASFFRLRCVCKRWNYLIYTHRFLHICSQLQIPRLWFLMFRVGGISTEGFLYNPLDREWIKLPLSFLPPKHQVVATAGGVFCCISEVAGYKTLYICNPFTKAWIGLPPTLKERFVPTVGFVVNNQTNEYKVMVAGDDMISPFAVKNLTTEVYDSRFRGWQMTGALPRLCNLESGKSVFLHGFLYSMTFSPFSLLAYQIDEGAWSKIQAPMRRFLRTPNLVVCRDRLLLVAAVEKNKLNVPKSIRIWGLQTPNNVWVELERMPQSLYDDFIRVSCDSAFTCIGHGDLILITIRESADQILEFNTLTKIWRWLPRCPYIGNFERKGLQGFPLEARLDGPL